MNIIMNNKRYNSPLRAPSGYNTIKLYKYISSVALNDLVHNLRLKVSFSSDTNDPFELSLAGKLNCNCGSRKEETVGFVSMTSDNNSPPMWGNYADKYKGACIEFAFPYFKERKHLKQERIDLFIGYAMHLMKRRDIVMYAWRTLDFDGNKDFSSIVRDVGDVIYKVVYRNERVGSIKGGGYLTYWENDRDIIDHYEQRRYLYTKHPKWKQENEFRILFQRDNLTNDKSLWFTKDIIPYITGITLGPLCNFTPEYVYSCLFARKNFLHPMGKVALRKACFSQTRYDLEFDEPEYYLT